MHVTKLIDMYASATDVCPTRWTFNDDNYEYLKSSPSGLIKIILI